MSIFEIILIVCLSVLALGILVIAIRGKFTIDVKRNITTKKELDPIQLRIMQENLDELKRYNDNAEKAAAEHTQNIKTITESVQTALGVMDDTK